MLAFFQDRGHDCVEIKRFQILVMIGVSIFAVFLANPEWNEIWTIAARFISGAPNDNFRKNICSEDDLTSRIFETFVAKLLACLPLLGFQTSKKWYNCLFLTDFYPKKNFLLEFSGAFFLAEIFEKVSFDPYNFRITRLSARKSEQMKNF